MLDDTSALPSTVLADLPIAVILDRLSRQELDPTLLPVEVRRDCVDQLTQDGFTLAQIGQLLCISDRAVSRDRAAIQRDGALPPGRKLGDELLGNLQRQTNSLTQRLTQLAIDDGAPHYVRVWAWQVIHRAARDLLDAAIRLQYLETGQTRLDYDRATDPKEQKRNRERIQGNLRAWSAAPLGRKGESAVR